MGDTSGCQISSNNLAVYLQGVTVIPSVNITSEYFVTASLPSSASTRRVWQFQSQGKITGPLTATLTLDYTVAHENCPSYNITFDGRLNGTFIVHNQVFSANKFISYQLTSTYVLVLTLRIPKTIVECFGDKPQNYSFSVNINDATATSSTYVLADFQQSDLNTTQVLQGTTSSGALCNWSNRQSYYWQSIEESGSGYLVLSSTVSSTDCFGPVSFIIDTSGGLPSNTAYLGLQFDVGLATPNPFCLTVSSNNTSASTDLYFVSTGQYAVQLILNYSTTIFELQVQSASLSTTNGFLFITISPSKTLTYPVLDANGNTLYETNAFTVLLVTNFDVSTIIYISFATSPVSGDSLQLQNFSTSSDVRILVPSTGSYQQVFITDSTSTTFYYCEGTWQTYSCAILSFSYTTNNSLTSTIIEGPNDCTWSESQTYSYPGSYSNDASGNPVYTGYIQFAGNSSSSSCYAPANLVLSITDFPTTTTGTVLLGLEFDSDSTTSFSNPSTIIIDYGATTTSTVSLPYSVSASIPSPYGYIFQYSASTGWQVQNATTASSSVLYAVPVLSNGLTITITDVDENKLYYTGSSSSSIETLISTPELYVSFTSSPSQNQSFSGSILSTSTDVYVATTIQEYQYIESFENNIYYFYCGTSWGFNEC